MNLCAGVVLYNPSDSFSNYISHYINSISHIIVYDNSPSSTHEEHKRYLAEKYGTKLIWINTDGYNHGISVALNGIFEEAIKHGCDYCITFDQDSYLDDYEICLMRECIETNQAQDFTAVYAPNYFLGGAAP